MITTPIVSGEPGQAPHQRDLARDAAAKAADADGGRPLVAISAVLSMRHAALAAIGSSDYVGPDEPALVVLARGSFEDTLDHPPQANVPTTFDELVLVLNPQDGRTLDVVSAQSTGSPVSIDSLGVVTPIPISK